MRAKKKSTKEFCTKMDPRALSARIKPDPYGNPAPGMMKVSEMWTHLEGVDDDGQLQANIGVRAANTPICGCWSLYVRPLSLMAVVGGKQFLLDWWDSSGSFQSGPAQSNESDAFDCSDRLDFRLDWIAVWIQQTTGKLWPVLRKQTYCPFQLAS